MCALTNLISLMYRRVRYFCEDRASRALLFADVVNTPWIQIWPGHEWSMKALEMSLVMDGDSLRLTSLLSTSMTMQFCFQFRLQIETESRGLMSPRLLMPLLKPKLRCDKVNQTRLIPLATSEPRTIMHHKCWYWQWQWHSRFKRQRDLRHQHMKHLISCRRNNAERIRRMN